jgi:hypothetical protein
VSLVVGDKEVRGGLPEAAERCDEDVMGYSQQAWLISLEKDRRSALVCYIVLSGWLVVVGNGPWTLYCCTNDTTESENQNKSKTNCVVNV